MAVGDVSPGSAPEGGAKDFIAPKAARADAGNASKKTWLICRELEIQGI